MPIPAAAPPKKSARKAPAYDPQPVPAPKEARAPLRAAPYAMKATPK